MFFESRAIEALASFLQAAALEHKSLEELVTWCMRDDDPTAANILVRRPDAEVQGLALRGIQNLVQETRDGVFETLRDAISPLADPVARAMCVDGPAATGFDVERFLELRGTVYVLGSEETAPDLAPLVTAFVDEVLFHSGQLALATPAERLDPPLTCVLDELPNICPLPRLPSIVSDSAGRGILVHWSAQGRSQLVESFGETGAETLIDNSTAITAFGGIKSETSGWCCCAGSESRSAGRGSPPRWGSTWTARFRRRSATCSRQPRFASSRLGGCW